ncbi:MAG: Rieske 2Fe-2S domain-containing protein [Chromatiales bacterium]|nr:Rieske 2Fe-2S domain-containing protein [Chromatiales bacterium]
MNEREWPVCGEDELGDPGAHAFETGDGDWPFRGFVVRSQGGLYAYANVCPHRQHPLNLVGDDFLTPDGTLLRCASHGAMFEIATGHCVLGPCTGQALISLPVRVADGRVLVTAPDSLESVPGLLSR